MSAFQWGFADVDDDEGERKLLVLWVNDEPVWVGPAEYGVQAAVDFVELLLDQGMDGAVEQFPWLAHFHQQGDSRLAS